MRSQYDDLSYGGKRERANHPIIEEHLGVRLEKLDKYNVMDWREIPTDGDESPLWNVEQKARQCSFEFCKTNYFYKNIPTALIGKNKIDYMRSQGNGIVYFDFTDKLMYWVFDEEEYKTFEIEEQFVRNARNDCVDKPSPVVHIPCAILKECLIGRGKGV